MRIQTQPKVYAAVDTEDRRYEVLDVFLPVDESNKNLLLLLLRDEKKRLAVFSRQLAVFAGYKQKSSIVRLMMRTDDFTEEYHYRLEKAPLWSQLRKKVAGRWKSAADALDGTRGVLALVYVPGVEVLSRVSRMDFSLLSRNLSRVQDLLGGAEVSKEEVELDQFLSTISEDEEPEPAEAVLREQDQIELSANPSTDLLSQRLYLKASQVLPSNGAYNSSARGGQLASALLATGVDFDHLEVDLRGLKPQVQISPFLAGFMQVLEERRPDKIREANRIAWHTDHQFQAQDITKWFNNYKPKKQLWTPPGFPSEFAVPSPEWLGQLYMRCLQLGLRSPQSQGTSLPNLVVLLEPLFQVMGYLDEDGHPVGDGCYFLHRHEDQLWYHVQFCLALLWVFLLDNPHLPYHSFMVYDHPFKMDLKRVRITTQKWVSVRSSHLKKEAQG